MTQNEPLYGQNRAEKDRADSLHNLTSVFTTEVKYKIIQRLVCILKVKQGRSLRNELLGKAFILFNTAATFGQMAAV